MQYYYIHDRWTIAHTYTIMVRTNKAPAVDAGALDDLDLDGMFAEQGDLLFEGFDMELGGMDDIVAQEKATVVAVEAAAPPPASKRTGPRTKRTNPMIPEEEHDGPKRRKTKRKSKLPSAYEEDGEFSEEAPKKKRKAAMKKQGGKDLDATTTSSTSKKPKKKKETAQSKKAASASFTAQVAAAGQFGGRVKRNSSQGGTTKVKRKPKKGEAEDVAVPLVTQPPKPEPSFCGLQPSNTTFYPFMEAVPPQPNLKNKKLYPGFDKIFSALTSSLIKPLDNLNENEYDQNMTLETPIFKLLSETFESISEKERQAFSDDKKQTLLKSIPHMRKFINKYDRQKVIADVYALLGLLGRQYDFLKTSLDNMNSWCQAEFSPQEYKSTYQPSSSKNRAAEQQQYKWKSSFVKVKVSCYGHKEPKGTAQLLALLPRSAVAMPMAMGKEVSASSTASTVTSSNKKKSKSKLGITPSAPVPAVPKTYAECSPQERRARIVERLTKFASDLQESHRNSQIKKELGARKKSLMEEEEHLATIKMWEFMENKGFYKPPTSASLSMNTPQILPNKVALPEPTKIRGVFYKQKENEEEEEVTEDGEGETKEEAKDSMEISSNSLFDRLQSLLVEEDEDDDDIEELESDSDEDENSSDDESLGFLDEDEVDEDVTDPMQASRLPVVDLSQLSLEERTFIQLSHAGLLPTSLFPKVELVLSSADKQPQDDDFCNVMGKMAEALSGITAKNNARVAFLESAVINMDLPYAKQREDEQASLIAKCHNLIKRNKEKAKKSNSKKKDDLNLPW